MVISHNKTREITIRVNSSWNEKKLVSFAGMVNPGNVRSVILPYTVKQFTNYVCFFLQNKLIYLCKFTSSFIWNPREGCGIKSPVDMQNLQKLSCTKQSLSTSFGRYSINIYLFCFNAMNNNTNVCLKYHQYALYWCCKTVMNIVKWFPQAHCNSSSSSSSKFYFQQNATMEQYQEKNTL